MLLLMPQFSPQRQISKSSLPRQSIGLASRHLSNSQQALTQVLRSASFPADLRLKARLLKAAEELGESARLISALGRIPFAQWGELDILPRLSQGPLNMLLCRHGRSEGNAKDELARQGRLTAKMKEYLRRTPNNHYRLVGLGRSQAIGAGEWIDTNFDQPIHAAYCSYFVRARETAGLLGKRIQLDLPWRLDSLVGERLWGDFDQLPEEMKQHEYRRRDANARYWTPPNGESLRLVELYAGSVMRTLYRKYHDQNVLIVTHGEFITAMRSIIEHLPEDGLNRLIQEGIPNCGIVHYTRKNPWSRSGQCAPHFKWFRLVCPWNLKWKSGQWNGEWREIKKPMFTSEELLEGVAEFPGQLP